MGTQRPGVSRIVGKLAPEAEHHRLLGLDEGGIVPAAADAAALSDVHVALVVEGDVGDREAARRAADLELAARVGGERSVQLDADRPDFGSVGDRVIEAAALHGHSPDHALRARQPPRIRVRRIEGDGLDVHPLRRRREFAESPAAVRPASPWSNVSIGVPSSLRR